MHAERGDEGWGEGFMFFWWTNVFVALALFPQILHTMFGKSKYIAGGNEFLIKDSIPRETRWKKIIFILCSERLI